MWRHSHKVSSYTKGVLAITFVLVLNACGGGGGSSTSPTTNSDNEILSTATEGYVVPSEISAVSVRLSGLLGGIPGRALQKPLDELPPSSDYSKALPQRYVEEHTLEQFDFLEQLLGAIKQTHFGDTENINAGPYRAMVAWEDEQDGRDVKMLQSWVVDSRMIVDDQDRDVNRVLFWIEESDGPDGAGLIKAELKIYESATIEPNGDASHYGEWVMNVTFDDGTDDFFTASSGTENGINVVRVQDRFMEGPSGSEVAISMKGILYRSDTTGYGQVSYPDWEFCWVDSSQNCTPPIVRAKYAYNDSYLAIQQNDDSVGYRSRLSTTDMIHEYSLYYKDASGAIADGDNVKRHQSFGFPVTYDDSSGTQYVYYGAWQGRHELWAGDEGGSIAPGTTVTKENYGANTTPEIFTVSTVFSGTLTKRTLADASLDDIRNIPVETWINESYELVYSGAQWEHCDGFWDWSGFSPVCRDRVTSQMESPSPFTNFAAFEMGDGGRKWVSIIIYDGFLEADYVYLSSNPGITGFTFRGSGFYEAGYDSNFDLVPVTPEILYVPSASDEMWADIGGSIYIQYTGDFSAGKTGWIQKQLTNFIEETWTPIFASSASDTDFSPEPGTEYYIDSPGASYIVRRTSAENAQASYDVKSELQTPANPLNFNTLLPAGTDHLRLPWNPDVKFTLVTDSSSINFLKLVYQTDDPTTVEDDTGTVYINSDWGLQAYNASDQPLTETGTVVAVDEWGFPQAGQPRPLEFNWEYSTSGWGSQQFLLDSDGNYHLLDSPIQLTPITLTNGADTSRTLSLQFDGWMHGLPDLYDELSNSEWVMTRQIADKIVSIPAGTEVTDSNGVAYFVKPLDISVFLDPITAGGISTAGGTVPDITNASLADLETVPDLTPHGMGAMPTNVVIKYSEGNPVK